MKNFFELATQSLAATPTMLNSWLTNLPEELLLKCEMADAWNTKEVIKHLIFNEKTDWMVRLRLMLANKNKLSAPIFEPFDRKGHFANKEENIKKLLKEFSELRMQNLDDLKYLAKAHNLMNLKGIHPALGPVNGKELIATWTVHDQTHVYQIARNMTSLFVKDVGPWSAYLKIVNQNQYD